MILRVWPQGLDFSAPRYANKHPWDPAAAGYNLIAKTQKSRPVLREPGAWGLKTDNPRRVTTNQKMPWQPCPSSQLTKTQLLSIT